MCVVVLNMTCYRSYNPYPSNRYHMVMEHQRDELLFLRAQWSNKLLASGSHPGAGARSQHVTHLGCISHDMPTDVHTI